MEQLIQNHLEKIEDLEEKLDANIISIVDGLDIDEVIVNPQTTLLDHVELVEILLTNEFMPKATVLGRDLAKGLEGLK